MPSRSDPRLKLSAIIVALQVLGQTALGFKVSIAQILVSIAVCGVIDLAVTLGREGVLAWPASGMLTGNSVAFILRASGTEHGDWWSLHGAQYFVLAGVVSLASKHLIRPGGRHRFNPSNVGLVWCLLVIGPAHVFPQYLWWGPVGVPVGVALAVIVLGAAWLLRSVGMIPMVLSFLVTFWALVGVLAASGRSFIAVWHSGPVSGLDYWLNISLSPELLIFVCFMMTDPKTAPRTRRGRVVFGAATAVVAAALLAFQPTEFGIKVAILASLTATCAVAPLLDGVRDDRALSRAFGRRTWGPALIAVAVIAVGAVVDTARLAGDKQLIYIERGLTGARDPQ